ncbi:MAG: mannose-1-phosphate guanylyltransferase [Planctomycetes bacterium]|nr:mannose-1-phosphate guanylyltransferase [Planctomycetota bacterium]
MRHALIIAGGSGTRLWPMSRAGLPKQLIPFIGGKSLLQIAADRLAGLIPDERIHICAAESHRDSIVKLLKGGEPAGRFYGEPMGRDTVNAIGLGAAIIGHKDPEAVIAIFTADHIIEPADEFRKIVAQGYELAESQPDTLVTFGIKPTHAATAYGYLELGDALSPTARLVRQFKEKPDAATAKRYADAGPDHYLWNSGMFVWRASTLMDCIRRFVPENYDGLAKLGRAWHTDARKTLLAEIYPKLKKISVDFAIMEPASRDPVVKVAAVPMPLTWLDIGSWPAFAVTRPTDGRGNAIAAEHHALVDCSNTLVASSDPQHLVTAIGCDDLIIIHTPDATLVCRADRAEEIKKLHELVGKKEGGRWL